MKSSTLTDYYKEHLSDFRSWNQISHSDDYIYFTYNLGESISIDETAFSNGELYTIITNKDGHGGPGTIVAVVHGTKAENVITVIETISRKKRLRVEEITLDLSSSMMLIARTVFPKARITNDRFHVQKIYYEAVDDLRISLRWMVRDNSPVDLGLWSTFIDKANLYIPLDTHVLQSAAKLKIMNGKPAGWKAVTSLTRHMAEAFPGDPARADYALYGYGIAG